jgi:hypothetical protein
MRWLTAIDYSQYELRSPRFAEREKGSTSMETSSIHEEAIGEVVLNQRSFQEGTNKERKRNPIRVYEGFLMLPVPIVLAVLWLAAAALMSVCGVALYLLWTSLATVAMG